MNQSNTLLQGEPRLGWLHIDGQPRTAYIAAVLLDTGASIELTLLLDDIEGDDYYERWWSGNVLYLDDPDRTRHSYEPPRVMVFRDTAGQVVLVGCRATSYQSNSSTGHGKIVCNFAVLGGNHFGYEKVNGLRTESDAITEWTGLSAMAIERQSDEKGRTRAVTLSLSSPPDVSVSKRLNVILRVTWRSERPRNGFVAHQAVQLQTHTSDVRRWNEHLDVHDALLELVSISGWRPFGFSRVEVRLDVDQVRVSPDKPAEAPWLQVAHHRLQKQSVPLERSRFLFPYSEIGARGIRRWLKLRSEYDRVVGALMSILRSEEPWSVSSVVQSGIALEALGYAIDVNKNDGSHLDRRGQMTFNTSLQVVLDDMKVKPFTNTDEWIARSNAAYMGAKHANRGEFPDSLDMANSLRENLQILRFWVGLEIGVKPSTLVRELQLDPYRGPFRLMD
ncbi:hypothetical protein [Leifsonia sp. NCR5]|uniref:ApeA N-terminal domain 1-containing protein n=1 Tax=Leifsonia sp. NCR5 TaxID=1978342 RepID=UPI00117BCE85|nr:hypothetical protein [Leifsonia sp. NCR5]